MVIARVLFRRTALAQPQPCLGFFQPSANARASVCRSVPHDAKSLPTAVRTWRTPVPCTTNVARDHVLSEHVPSVLQFIRTRVLNATHRDGLRFGRGSSSGWGRPPPRRGWLDSLDGNVIFYGIIAVNVGVYLAWQSAISSYRVMGDPTLLKALRDNFLVDIRNISAGRFWTLLTACFSHQDTSHALFNGLTFYFMAPAVMQLLGNKRFLALYFLGGITSSLASVAWNTFVRHENISSHGASGAIMATLALYACAFPRNTFLIFFVIPCPAWVFLPGILLYDGWRSISDRRSTTDSAGHVGGLLTGIAYYAWRFGLKR
ncbi:hypothetical protein ID866_3785 [Astraeus odoratus]|nr:hypothetical protein ID866_3785 [Astraeus odoratus]